MPVKDFDQESAFGLQPPAGEIKCKFGQRNDSGLIAQGNTRDIGRHVGKNKPGFVASEQFFELVEVCRARKVAVQTIKSALHAPWDGHAPTRATWYRPLEKQADLDLAVHWVLGHEGLFLNSAGDVHILPKVLDAASRFAGPPAEAEMQALVDRLGMRTLFP